MTSTYLTPSTYLTRQHFIDDMQGCFSMAEVHLVEVPGKIIVLVAGEAMQQELTAARLRASDILPVGVTTDFHHFEDAKQAEARMAAFKLVGAQAFFGYPKPDL